MCEDQQYVMKEMTNKPKSAHIVISNVFVFVQDSEKYVEQLLTLFKCFSKLVKEAFQDDPRFLTARDKVCSFHFHVQHEKNPVKIKN